MEFKILGPLEVVEDGLPLPLGHGRERALLALLLLRANEVVSADVLIDGPMARAATRDCCKGAAGLRLQTPEAARSRCGRHASAGLRDRGRRGSARSDPIRAARPAGSRRRPTHRRVPASRRAVALARLSARRVCERALRAARDPAPRGAAACGARGPYRRRPGPWPPRGYSSASSSSSSTGIPTASDCAVSSCSRSTAPVARRTPSRRIGMHGAVLTQELGLEPSPELRELERQILAHDETQSASPPDGESVARTRKPRGARAPPPKVRRRRSRLSARACVACSPPGSAAARGGTDGEVAI